MGADTLSLALSRNARLVGDRVKFDRALQFIIPQQEHDAALRNAIAYENCLWDLAAGDLMGLVTRLDGWRPDHSETLWTLRKAGLLAEMQDDARACALLGATLNQIRRARRRDFDDLVSLSLESWALYLALAYSERWLRAPVLPNESVEPFERWRALGIVDCDAFSEYRALRQSLEGDRPTSQVRRVKTRSFDLGRVSVSHSIESGPRRPIIAAYQVILLAEVTGIPPAANHMNLFQDGLTLAAKILATEQPWLASQLAIRIETSDKSVEDIFSRARIARLPDRLVSMLYETLLKRLAFGKSKFGASGSEQSLAIPKIIGPALEILSRVAVRLRSEQLHTLFEEALSYYRSPPFRRRSLFLGTPLANLLARILETLSRAEIVNLLPGMFALPLPQEVGFETDSRRWSDPVAGIPNWFEGTIGGIGSHSPQWEGIISHLLIVAKGNNAIDRGAAIYRLSKLHDWQILNDAEKTAFAGALWVPAQRDDFGIPKNTNRRPVELLAMPEEQPSQARDTLTQYITKRSHEQGGDVNERLAAIGEVLWHFAKQRIAIELPLNVQTSLAALISAWAIHRSQRPRHEIEPAMNQRDLHELAAVDGVSAILPSIKINDDLIRNIWEKVEATAPIPAPHTRSRSTRSWCNIYRSGRRNCSINCDEL
jgi:hypothetical protein